MGDRLRAPHQRSTHARIVLVPAGCWSVGLVLDIASRFSAEPGFVVRAATTLIGLGLVGAVIAGIAGMVEAAPVPAGSATHRRVLVHLGVAMVATVVVAFGLIVRIASQDGGPAAPATLATSALGVLVLLATAVTGRLVRGSRARRGAPAVATDRPVPKP